MHKFEKDWNFKITTTRSLTYAQSNGQSERYVQTVKGLIRKAVEENKDPNLAPLAYRNRPIYGIKKSLAQLFCERQLQDQIPTTLKLLKPQWVADLNHKIQDRQNKHKFYYDRSARQHRTFQPSDNIRVQFGKTWEKAIITATHKTLRSYEVVTEDGTTLRRNQRFIYPSYEPTTVIPADVMEDNTTTA
ncbi:retrovirus-related Pol polyprotein from transposon 17.6 [Elysia marginata]|uniref:Retrovirus-related Pol polyprotein from transposon 17.6 n=1 Tax=Elysia marginata TaxID=1093978 RepID=A0AAV4EF01_9GAST|nr:retrovirus-related Pol polyprotein from transposon 17.6 [Elysia marginata]